MVAKKSPQANLENKKTFFVLIGFVLVLSLVFIAFEWSRKDINRYAGINYDKEFTEEIIIPQTAEKAPPPPPPPPASIEQIEIVDNHTETKPVEFTSEAIKNEPIPFIGNPIPLDKNEDDTDIPFIYVESMPQFPGNILKFLSEHVNYPVIAIENQIQGRVVCEFVVNRDGSIVDVVVIGSVHPSLDKEAVRVIKSMPKWIPGKQRGKPVRVKYTLPVSFKLMM
ncbi:MAG: energy transducer TonB [Paludibacter sp.]|nr:energy transducer TonB [Paludibacter sp.]